MSDLQERPPLIYVTETGEKVPWDKGWQRHLQEKLAEIWMKQTLNAANDAIFGEQSQNR